MKRYLIEYIVTSGCDIFIGEVVIAENQSEALELKQVVAAVDRQDLTIFEMGSYDPLSIVYDYT